MEKDNKLKSICENVWNKWYLNSQESVMGVGKTILPQGIAQLKTKALYLQEGKRVSETVHGTK